MQLNINDIKRNGWLIFEAITGSRAYGLNTASSDTDIRGVFVLPKEYFYSLQYVAQVANETNDIVYYELGRFIELLSKSNPNILEMLGIDDKFILRQHRLMKSIKQEWVLSKECMQTFANYAYSQIKKARGLEKKIMNPMDGIRKTVIDFCYVYISGKSIPLAEFLSQNSLTQEQLGLAAVPHLRDCFNVYHSEASLYSGIVRKDSSNEICLSHIPAGESPVALLSFNRDGYSVHCKKYKEYQEWLLRRNEARYTATLQHGGRYDAKNMMHVFRLLFMAKEIALERKIQVFRNDREFLLAIKSGKFKYEDLVQRAQALREELLDLYEQAELPDRPIIERLNDLLVNLRNSFYH